jgi:hypothetical protein
MNEMDQPERLTARQGQKVAVVSGTLGLFFTGIFVAIFCFMDPSETVRKYPVDPTGWVVVRYRVNREEIVRPATASDMWWAKYKGWVTAVGYAGLMTVMGVLFSQGLRRKKTVLTRAFLGAMKR